MKIPDILVGTFQVYNQQEMDTIIEAAVQGGIFAFDTAPSYSTEFYLGNSLKKYIDLGKIKRENIWVQSKIDAIHMLNHRNNGIQEQLKLQLNKMSLEYLDALLVHWPFKKYFFETWNQMLDAKAKGMVKKIGVCNINKRLYTDLFEKPQLLHPDIIQNEISPLNSCIDEVDFYRNKHIEVEAYSPLCRMVDSLKLDEGLKKIANDKNTNVGKVILKWHIQRAIHPIFASKNPNRIIDNSCLDFELSKEDIDYINSLNQCYKIFPFSYGCPE